MKRRIRVMQTMQSPSSLSAAYRQAFEAASRPMWLFDAASLRVLDVNSAALVEYGVSRDAFVAMSGNELLGIQSFAAGTDPHVHMTRHRHDGTTTQLEATLYLLPGTTPAVGLCTLSDGAHFAPADERLRAVNEQVVLSGLREQAAREEAERANRAKDQFLAIISHELRTPLQAIAGWVHLLRLRKLNAEDVEHALEVIDRNTRIQTQLVADLLDVSRAANGKLNLQLAALDVRTPLNAAIQSITSAADAAGVRLNVSLSPSEVTVEGDPIRLEQIFVNLLSNAVKFTPAGGAVQVDVDADIDWAHIRVADTGQGFSGSFLARLFDPFSQEDATSTRGHGGLGLGLMIVEHLVAAHHGRIRAASSGKSAGATFLVDLPRIDRPADEVAEGARASEQDAPVLTGLRVLVVEDHADSRELLRTILQRFGAQVREADSARKALALLGETNVDVVVTDLGMPDVDGYDFLRALRRDECPARDVPVVALTAFAAADESERARTAGFNAFVAKPVDPRQLASVVADVVPRTGGHV
jgi:signal transduction histidine kinase